MQREVYEIKEVYINQTKGYQIDSTSLPIKDSTITTLKELYKYGLERYGKCKSKVYNDSPADNYYQQIGYVFEKRQKYEDTKESYIQEIWLTIEHYIETTLRKQLEV